MHKLFKMYDFLRDTADDGNKGDAGDGTAVAEEQSQEEKDAAAQVSEQKRAADAAAAAAKAQAETPEKIEAINAQIAEQNKKLDTLIEKVDPKNTNGEWTIEKLEEAELKCHAGEYDMKYLPKITTMKALLTARQVAKETTDGFAKENTWQDVQAKWEKGQHTAIEVFGDEAKDPESKLFKTAQAILHQDPGFKRYHELKAQGVKLSNIDPTLIDPNLQFKCFEIAAGRLGVARKDAAPNPNGKPGSKSALGGGSLPRNEEGQSLLDRLEKRAVDTGNPADWIALQKEQLKQNRLK